MDIDAFLSADKSMVIAPAGYGKTYTIAECIASYRGEKKVLVLTHTHAGVASLREKFDQRQISPSLYHLETICGFALNLTEIYHVNKDEIPSFAETESVFCFAVEHATKILRSQPIRKYLSIKYDHLIVDEYQDCTAIQHQMIMVLSTTLKTHILGDPLQGIFEFRNDSVVDFSDASFVPFNQNCQTLSEPWRWNNAGRSVLAEELSSIREKLCGSGCIDLRDYKEIKVVIAEEKDYATPKSSYKNEIYRALQGDSVLLIHPRSESPEPRIKFVQQFSKLRMIESVDDKLFYSSCASLEKASGEILIAEILDIMRKIGTKSKIDVWFNDAGRLKRKKDDAGRQCSESMECIRTALITEKSYAKIAMLMDAIADLSDVKIYRKDFLRDVGQILRNAERLGISLIDSLERNRNILRRMGRKVQGKGIGTTLLTKGLEFDTVVVLNAHQFKDRKNLYVALTRCCRKLIVISNNYILNPPPLLNYFAVQS